MSDITDKEFNKRYLPFYNNMNEYLNNYIIPDTVAFYLSNAYYRHCLTDNKLYNHINSAIDIFNCDCNIVSLIANVEELLKIKYNLEIININPLRLKRYY